MYTYPSNYKPKPLNDQWDILTKAFKKLKSVDFSSIETPFTHPAQESLFAIPHWSLIGKTYVEAVKNVFKAIEKSRDFTNWREDQMDESHLRQTPEKEKMWNDFDGLVWIAPAQFGKRHKGKSVETVRKEMKNGGIGLGAYEVAIILLTHPDRLQDFDDLWVDCPGDEFADSAGVAFDRAPRFEFFDGMLGFGTRLVSFAFDFYGSVSAFVSQPLESRTLVPLESLTLEKAIEMVKKEGYKVIKEL